jgi:hypothetical protein
MYGSKITFSQFEALTALLWVISKLPDLTTVIPPVLVAPK